MDKQEYFSEEELAEFIENMEREPLLEAPRYLKKQILQKAAKRENTLQQNTFLLFSAKVAAGAAASIALLFFLPDLSHYDRPPQNTAAFYENEHALLKGLNEKTAQFCNFINDTANSVFIKEDDLK